MATQETRAFTVRNGDQDRLVEVQADGRVRVQGHETPFEVARSPDGAYLVRDGHRAWRVHVAGPPAERRVFADGCAATVEVVPAGERRTRTRGHGDAAAPMPGTVLEIAVTVGQHVRAGAVLVTLEAMKMELPVRAPREGTVTAIHCTEGELVQPGIVLVDIA